MPTYQFKCKGCGTSFEATATIEEKTRGLDLACVACGEKDVSQVFGGFAFHSKGKSADSSKGKSGNPGPSRGCGCGGNCGCAHG
jgi:putative FmdB family regulatory protein